VTLEDNSHLDINVFIFDFYIVLPDDHTEDGLLFLRAQVDDGLTPFPIGPVLPTRTFEGFEDRLGSPILGFLLNFLLSGAHISLFWNINA
jgi:hypothetical protein